MAGELMHLETGSMTELSHGLRDPNEIVKEATKRALILKDIVDQTKCSIKIGKGEHLKIEGWVTVGQFYNCTARCKATEAIEIHGVPGFLARAQLTHDQTGAVLSEAEAYCMRDEEKWNTRPKYAYENGERVEVGSEPVPTFQLASMAQTRAMAKVLAAKFRWVVVLAGYAETPAEEMTGNEETAQPRAKPALKPKPKQAPLMPFGHSKGKRIDDVEVPVQDLEYMLKYVSENIGSAKRKNYEKQDREFIKALEEELRKRSQPDYGQLSNGAQGVTTGYAKNTAPRETSAETEAIPDDVWADLCQLWEQTKTDQFVALQEELGVKNALRLAPEYRVSFRDRMVVK